jgi:hypothetical protein
LDRIDGEIMKMIYNEIDELQISKSFISSKLKDEGLDLPSLWD